MDLNNIHSLMEQNHICVLVPAYNSEKTIIEVVKSVLEYTNNIIVVNDGSTDKTEKLLSDLGERIELVSYPVNKGKGYALKQGFNKANQQGYAYVITIDADGQHLAEDIPIFVNTILQPEHRHAVIIGTRSFDHPNMPQGNIFANKFSNFWFTLQTAKRLPDTQSGYRLYPLCIMKNMRPHTNRYEAELELLVRCAWKGIPIISAPINVHYPPQEERVSHFRPKKDFFRISMLNTLFCILAIIYGYPSMFIRKLIRINK